MKKESFIKDHKMKVKSKSNVYKNIDSINSGNTRFSLNTPNNFFYSNYDDDDDNLNMNHRNSNFINNNININDQQLRLKTDNSESIEGRNRIITSGNINSQVTTNNNTNNANTIFTGKRTPNSDAYIRKKRATEYSSRVNINNVRSNNNYRLTKQSSKERPMFSTSNSKSHSKSKTKSPIGRRNLMDEEEINIKIPQPYPQNQYMLIEDKRLVDSRYTNFLNDLYPPRKYVKHNLTSSNKMNKHSKNLYVKFMNPKLNNIALENIHNNIDELKLDYINSLPEALTIIQKLKIKILEYDNANNKNIELAIRHINSLEEENEFLKQQLVDSYNKLTKYTDKYGDEILNKHVYNIVNKFKLKWAKIKIFRFITKTIALNHYYDNIINDHLLKNQYKLIFKGFMCLQRAYINSTFTDQLSQRRVITSIKEMFDLININRILNQKEKKYKKIHKAISLIFFFKNLNANRFKSKEIKLKEKKSRTCNYFKALKKSFASMKVNLLYSIKYGLNNSRDFLNNSNNAISNNSLYNTNRNEFYKSTAQSNLKNHYQSNFSLITDNVGNYNNKIGFTKFFRDINKLDAPVVLKQKYSEALSLMRKTILKTHGKIENKFTFKSMLTTLSKHFNHWKTFSINVNQNIEFIINMAKGLTSLFFYKCKRRIILKDEPTNVKLIQASTICKALKLSKDKKIKRNIKLPAAILKYRYKTFLKRTTLVAKQTLLFKQKLAPILLKNYFEELKKNYVIKQSILFLKNFSDNAARKRLCIINSNLMKAKFFKICKNNILEKKKIVIIQNKHMNYEIFSKTISTIRTKCLMNRIFKIKNYYINLINNFKMIIEEKTQNILNIEGNYNLIRNDLVVLEQSNSELLNENNFLKTKINQLEIKIEDDSLKTNQLFEKNMKDINNLKNVLKNNEILLHSSIKREEELQNKYKTEIMSAIKMNKDLNGLIIKKNNEISELSILSKKKELIINDQISNLHKKAATTHIEYSSYLDLQNQAYKNLIKDKEESDLRNQYKMNELEEEKVKNEYKSDLLEEENKAMVYELKQTLKKMNNK